MLRYAALLLMLALMATPALAREELVTLPTRDSVTLTIYNSVDLTLVSERRTLGFNQGENKLSFSWAGTTIDPTSVIFRAASDADSVSVADTTFPRESNQMLIWTIEAEEAGDYEVEISYFTSSISWSSEYHGVLNAEGTKMKLTSYLTVTNRSGEDYENASVRVVIGTLNLVETVNDLARPQARKEAFDKMRRANRAMAEMDSAADEKKEVIKDELGEYYIYTVEGTETVPHGWSKRLESFAIDNVPVKSVYTYNPNLYGAGLRRVFTFTNMKWDDELDAALQLGNEPLPGGTVRLYEDKGGNRLAYVAAIHSEYISKGDVVRIAGDVDPNVTLEIKRMKYERDRLDFQWTNNGRGGRNQRLTGWDDISTYEVVLKFPTKPGLKAEIYLNFWGDYSVQNAAGTELIKHDAYTWKIEIDQPRNDDAASGARSTITKGYIHTQANGSNAK